MSFRVEISGEYACFTRPEGLEARESYDVLTPSAARGILEAVMWRPAIEYVIDEIAVCSPIRFEEIRRNEIDFESGIAGETGGRIQRATNALRDVRYSVLAHFNMTDGAGEDDNENKFSQMIRRRLKKGQHFHAPYLGMREFPARVRLIDENDEGPQAIGETRGLGKMLYDMEYVKEQDETGAAVLIERKPRFFMAEMKRGVIDLRNIESLLVGGDGYVGG